MTCSSWVSKDGSIPTVRAIHTSKRQGYILFRWHRSLILASGIHGCLPGLVADSRHVSLAKVLVTARRGHEI